MQVKIPDLHLVATNFRTHKNTYTSKHWANCPTNIPFPSISPLFFSCIPTIFSYVTRRATYQLFSSRLLVPRHRILIYCHKSISMPKTAIRTARNWNYSKNLTNFHPPCCIPPNVSNHRALTRKKDPRNFHCHPSQLRSFDHEISSRGLNQLHIH